MFGRFSNLGIVSRFVLLLLLVSTVTASVQTQAQSRSSTFNSGGWGNDDDWDTDDEVPAPAGPAPGLEGVQLEPVPIDAAIACNAMLLKGSRRFPNTVFLFPRALISMDSKGQRMFEVIGQDDGSYLLRFSIFFPRMDQDFNVNGIIDAPSFRRCNIDEIKHTVNMQVGEAENAKVKAVANVPLSSIDVRLDGVEKPFVLAGGAATMLNYLETAHVVEFTFQDRKELEKIMMRIQGDIGLGIHVGMTFASRAADGGASIDIDMKQLSANVGAAIGGRHTIAAAELSTIISNSINDMNIRIETEEGSTQAHNRLVNQLMSLVMRAARQGMSNGQDDCDDDWGSSSSSSWGCDDDGGWGSNSGDDPVRRRRGDPPTLPEMGEGQMLVAAVVVDVMRNQGTYHFEYNNSGRAQSYVYRTSLYFNGDILDPDVREMQIDSGQKIIAGFGLEKDKTITLALSDIMRSQITYTPDVRYFTSDELTRRRMELPFAALNNTKKPLVEQTSPTGMVASLPVGNGWFNREYLVWGEVNMRPSSRVVETVELAPDKVSIDKVELYVSFDKIGVRKFKLSEFASENELWKGQYDRAGGRIIITPKQNLGTLTIWNRANPKTQDMETSWLFEEKRNTKQGVIATTKQNVVRQSVPTEKTTVHLLISYASIEDQYIDIQGRFRKSFVDNRKSSRIFRMFHPIQRPRNVPVLPFRLPIGKVNIGRKTSLVRRYQPTPAPTILRLDGGKVQQQRPSRARLRINNARAKLLQAGKRDGTLGSANHPGGRSGHKGQKPAPAKASRPK